MERVTKAMDRNGRIVSSACGIMRLEGMTVPGTVRDSILRCLRDEAVFDFAVVYVAGARAGYRSFHKVERSDEDPYCYAGSRTPVNRLNIRDANVLETRIRDVVAIRIAELEAHPITRRISSDYLRSIHRHLYGDIFSWAGEYRDTDYSDCPADCRAMHIEGCVAELLKDAENRDFFSDSPSLSEDLAHLISELSAISPFRVGSQVCILVLANIIAEMNGRYLDYSKASESLMDIAIRRGINGDASLLSEMMAKILDSY